LSHGNSGDIHWIVISHQTWIPYYEDFVVGLPPHSDKNK